MHGVGVRDQEDTRAVRAAGAAAAQHVAQAVAARQPLDREAQRGDAGRNEILHPVDRRGIVGRTLDAHPVEQLGE